MLNIIIPLISIAFDRLTDTLFKDKRSYDLLTQKIITWVILITL